VRHALGLSILLRSNLGETYKHYDIAYKSKLKLSEMQYNYFENERLQFTHKSGIIIRTGVCM